MRNRIDRVYIPQLSGGDLSDYASYLHNFLEAGGKLNSISDDLWPRYQDTLYIADEDCHVPEAHGVQSITVIAPSGITVTSGGHNQILLMDAPNTNPREAILSIDPQTARLIRENHGLELTEDHFSENAKANKEEFLWQLDRLNGHGLTARFRRAHDNERLTWPVIKQRLSNAGTALDRMYPAP